MDYNTNDDDQKARDNPSEIILDVDARAESLLFVADAPVSIGRLAKALQATEGQSKRRSPR